MSDPTNATTAPMSPPAPRPTSGGTWEEEIRADERAKVADPAPSGLTAAQKIRLALTLKAMDLADKATPADVEADDEDIADFVRVVTGVVAPLAAKVEHGDGMTREQLAAAMAERGIPEPPAACPDPSLHDADWAKRKYAELADVYATAAKQGERVAELERQHAEAGVLVLDLIGGMGGTTPRMLRAIYAGHGGQGARRCLAARRCPARNAGRSAVEKYLSEQLAALDGADRDDA